MNTLTPEQKSAVDFHGDLLVVASAGTGKTTTLVARCEKYIFDSNNPVSLDRILMVTFTEAAAAEMKLRIRRKLEEALVSGKPDSNAATQYALLPTAHISTLHSFCLRLVKLYFHELGLDPQIEVLEEGQARLLALRVLDEIFNRHYEGKSEFDKRVQDLIAVRSRGYDAAIREKILKLYYFAASLPFSDVWLKKQLEVFNNPEPDFWISLLDKEIHNWAGDWISRMEPISNVKNVEICLNALRQIRSCNSFEEALPLLKKCKNAIEDTWQRGTATSVRDRYLKEFIKDLEFFCSYLNETDNPSALDPLKEDWNLVRGQMATLIELAIEFNEEFSKAKREVNAVDFNDLEQMTLKLLFDSESKRTVIAEELQRRFDLIFVDEYQDINPVQHLIITAISREGGNRFLVGDGKQSIYQFRHANPYIFLKLADDWRENSNIGKVVNLTYNFRSHPEILDFVNALFFALMKKDVADMEYSEDAFLRSGVVQNTSNEGTESKPSPRVELHIILKDEDNENDADEYNNSDVSAEEPTIVQKEAAVIAERIRKLKNSGFEIFDKKSGSKRKIEWRDIAILLRSPANKSEIYAREFAIQGIPLIIPSGDALGAIECQDLINLLRLLDNPYQDLPLAAVLYSPLVGFSILELSLLRAASPKGKLWNAMKKFPQSKQDLEKRINESSMPDEEKQRLLKALESAAAKAEYFLGMYERWRKICRQISLSQTLEIILDDTQYIAWCQGQADGVRKYANVQVLLELTRQFDPLQRQGLSRFLRYIDSREEAEIETEPISYEGENAVRLMSIHQSKGLEFPVVFVADLGKKFNFRDISSDIILDDELGICPKVYSGLPGQNYPSPPHWVARKKKLRKLIGEEIRLLYVALTRGCDLVILTGSAATKRIKNLKDKLNNYEFTPQAITASQNMLEWICLWLWNHYKDDEWFEKEQGIARQLWWTKRKIDYASQISFIEKADSESRSDLTREEYKPEELIALDEKLKWTYPNKEDTLLTAKTSVSDIRRRFMQDLEEESSNLFRLSRLSVFTEPSEKPEELSATERGELYHKFLELVDLKKVNSVAELNDEIQRLIQSGKLSTDAAVNIDTEKIFQFWNSDTGRLFLSNISYLRRELPFTVKIAAKDLNVLPYFRHIKSLNDDFIILQGVIDLAMISDKEIWILDFKTDHINPEQIGERMQEYLPQLDLYGYALNKIFKLPVTHKWLHFIFLNKTIELPSGN